MKKFFSTTACLLLAFGLAAVVYAAPADVGAGGQGFQEGHGPGMHHMFHSPLNLSADQRQKMKEIRERFRADTHDLRYAIQEQRIEMRKLFTDPKADDAAITAKHKELSALVAKLKDRKFQMKLECRKVLTPEQIRMLDRFRFGRSMGRCMQRPMPMFHGSEGMRGGQDSMK